MFRADLVMISIRQVIRHRRRYRGVVLGLSLGVLGLMVILPLGDALIDFLSDNLEQLADAKIIRAGWDQRKSFLRHPASYSFKDVEVLRTFRGVLSASPAVSRWHVLDRGHKRTAPVRLMGVDESFFRTTGIAVSSGRKITEEDVRSGRRVCVVGPRIVSWLFPKDLNPIGGTVSIDGYLFQIVGVVGGLEFNVLWRTAFVPISVARSQFVGMHDIGELYVRAVNWEAVPGLHEDVKELLIHNHAANADAITVTYEGARIEKINNAVFVVKGLIWTALVLTIILGGLGITFTMLAAVTERTTEIGLKRALGATDSAILHQFLIEAVCISVIGALLGMLGGLVCVAVLKEELGLEPTHRLLLMATLGGSVGSAILGVLAGLVPARRATRIDPVDAMRFE
ncbi:MAG: ABC transporter permease [Thermodesulfobacteriota bacterium]